MSQKLKALFNGNATTLVSIVLCCLLIVWTYACESKVKSLDGNDTLVTRQELRLELNQQLSLAEERFRQLDRQDEFKQTIINSAIQFVRAGQINPMALLTTLLAILGVGQTTDAVRKVVKKKLKTPPRTSDATNGNTGPTGSGC